MNTEEMVELRLQVVLSGSESPNERFSVGSWWQPRVRKLQLTADCSQKLFGSLHPHRDANLPALFPIYRTAHGWLDEANAKIYNERQEAKYRNSKLGHVIHLVIAGIVEVKEGDWDVHLQNINVATKQQPSPRQGVAINAVAKIAEALNFNET